MKLLVLGLADLCREYQPQEVAIEKVFMARNPDSALKLGQARGRRSVVVLRDLPVHEYAASEIKLAVVGRGGAEKQQVQHMVGLMLNLKTKLQADALTRWRWRSPMPTYGQRPTAWGSVPARRGAANEELHAMIGRLRGIVAYKAPPWLVVDVNGVGYELEAPMSTFYDLPELYSRGHAVHPLRAEGRQRFAVRLPARGERRLFRDVQKVSGIGAKIALAVLSGVSVEEFARMVQAGDITALTRIPGIGKKTAERMVLELRDRAAQFGAGGALPTGSGPAPPTRCPMPPWPCSSWATSGRSGTHGPRRLQ